MEEKNPFAPAFVRLRAPELTPVEEIIEIPSKNNLRIYKISKEQSEFLDRFYGLNGARRPAPLPPAGKKKPGKAAPALPRDGEREEEDVHEQEL